MYSVFHEIVKDASTGLYLIALDDSLIISVSSMARLSTLSFTREGTGRLNEDGTVSDLNETVCKTFMSLHSWINVIYHERNGMT